MNVQLIGNLIASNNETCPEFTYSNPLLDKNVTTTLSKSFVKILNISNENTNKKLRHAVLENVRKMCKIEPDQHIKIDENLTELLISYYEKRIQDNKNLHNVDTIDKKLDAFLIRRSKEISINSSFRSTVNPEVTQALINLNEKIQLKDALSQEVIHWNQNDKRYLKILKDLWNCDKTLDSYDNRCNNLFDDTSIKIKTEIEKLLLDISYNLLHNDSAEAEEIITNNTYKTLIATCSVSPECFQICISILNTLFLINNFHSKIQSLIVIFIQKVKSDCTKFTFAILYPTHLTHLVTLLDINLEILPSSLRLNYVQITINYLKALQKQSESDLILLLSHFPQWDNIYFEQ